MRQRFLLNRISGCIDPFRSHYNGGGKGGDAPDAPDYVALAKLEAENQEKLLRQQTRANRVDQYGPLGNVTYQQGGGEPTFDAAGYERARQQYETSLSNYYANPGTNNYVPTNVLGGALSGSNTQRPMPQAPDRNSFYQPNGDPDKWSQTTTLNPESQKILDQNLLAKQQGYDQLQTALGNINNNNLPLASVNAGETAQDAILRRVNPQLAIQEDALRTRLVNQGVRPGTQAWDREFNLFTQARNDAVSQAALAGINVGNDARQRAIAEQGAPLNLINAYQSGSQVQMPNFTNYAQQGQGQAADLLGAAQSQYSAGLGQYNAEQAQGANTMNGLFSLGGSLLSGGLFGGLF